MVPHRSSSQLLSIVYRIGGILRIENDFYLHPGRNGVVIRRISSAECPRQGARQLPGELPHRRHHVLIGLGVARVGEDFDVDFGSRRDVWATTINVLTLLLDGMLWFMAMTQRGLRSVSGGETVRKGTRLYTDTLVEKNIEKSAEWFTRTIRSTPWTPRRPSRSRPSLFACSACPRRCRWCKKQHTFCRSCWRRWAR